MSLLCPLCAQTCFSSIDALRLRLIRATNGPLACPICHELFMGLDKLTIHLFSHTSLIAAATTTHTATNPITQPLAPQCDILTTTTTTTSAAPEVHTEAQLNNGYMDNTTSTCDVCEFQFGNDKLRDMHFRLVHQNVPEATTDLTAQTPATSGNKEHDFKCHLCAKTFKMKGSLRVHLKVVHYKGPPYTNNNGSKLNICERICKKNTMKICSSATGKTANISSPTETNESQTNEDHKFSVLVPQFHTNQSIVAEVEKNVVDQNPKIWECDVCTKSFTTKYFLKKHKRLHTGEMPYTCEICARTFTFQQSYHKHLLYHSDEKPHVCATCGRAFKELSTLHNHERIHSGEKPFKCEVCGKSFRQRVSFLVHTRIHTGVMPYKCENCDKSFRYKVSQRTHKCQPKTLAYEDANCSSSSTLDTEHMIQKFMDGTHDQQQTVELTAITNTTDEALLSKTIDDIVVESWQKMGLDNQSDLIGNYNGTPSPTQDMQNMHIFSPQQVHVDDSSSFPNFLLDDVTSNRLL